MDTRLKLLNFVVVVFINNAYAEDLLVETKLGTIRGVRSSDGEVNMYMGIPYASVNESNPFGASVPHPGFDNGTVFDANDDSSICPQIEEFNYTVVGDLDCLRLNVYTPVTSTSASQLPVFFYIYGGGFQVGFYGKFMYGPEFLVRHNVILVTVNYRLGPYGFMCLDIPEVPGNQGLKDTLMALRWVQKHIESFGGDPNKVTIGGNSVGGMITDYYLLRNSRGEVLFHNAILQSGTTLMPLPGKAVKNLALKITNYLGYGTNDNYAAIKFLAAVSPHVMIKSISNLNILTPPCIEKQFEGVEPFITENIITAAYQVENVSVMIGITNDEGRYRAQRYGLNGQDIVDEFLNLVFDTQCANLTGASTVESYYFGDRERGQGTLGATINFLSDITVVHPIHRCMNMLLKSSVKRLYYYMFTHDGERNFVKHRENYVGGGATHGDELGYLFDMEYMPEELTPEDQLVIDKMTAMWTNFIKYRDPTPQISSLLDVKWEPVSSTSPLHCMVIATNLSLIRKPFHDRMAFLDMFFGVNEHLLRG